MILDIVYMCSVKIMFLSLIKHSTNKFLPVQLVLLRSIDSADIEWVKEVKGNVYDMVVEGFQLVSRWTSRIWEQCAWKFSRPCKDPVLTESNGTPTSFSDYEKV